MTDLERLMLAEFIGVANQINQELASYDTTRKLYDTLQEMVPNKDEIAPEGLEPGVHPVQLTVGGRRVSLLLPLGGVKTVVGSIQHHLEGEISGIEQRINEHIKWIDENWKPLEDTYSHSDADITVSVKGYFEDIDPFRRRNQ